MSRTAKGWSIGADWAIGANNILAQYSTVGIDPADSRGAKVSLGFVHNLSKRTAFYGTFARVTNSGGSAFDARSGSSGSFGAVSGALNVNGGSTGFEFGVRHLF